MKMIVLLRGINVGGHRKILMADLRALLEKAGFKNVVTYIQSGNIVLDTKKTAENVENLIKKEIKKVYGFDVPVVARNAMEWQLLIEQNPSPVEEFLDRLYITFLHEIPDPERLAAFQKLTFDGDVFSCIGKHIFLCYETKTSNSKLSNNLIEAKLKVKATSRNWKTVMKLNELI